MKKIEANGTPAFQGDVLFRSVAALPLGAVEQTVPPTGAVIAHSETGHHHVATGTDFSWFAVPDDVMHAYLVARAPVTITHQRPTDTHEAFELGVGGQEVIWEIGRQREYIPEGWRQVVD
mgnify:CR=1 FL=1